MTAFQWIGTLGGCLYVLGTIIGVISGILKVIRDLNKKNRKYKDYYYAHHRDIDDDTESEYTPKKVPAGFMTKKERLEMEIKLLDKKISKAS